MVTKCTRTDIDAWFTTLEDIISMTEASYNSLRHKLKLDPNCSILKPPVYYGNSQEINFLWGSWNKATLKSLQKMMQSLTVLLSPDKSLCLCCQICTDWKLWKITTQSDWCAPIVQAAKKKGNVCICVDLKRFRKAVKHDHYILSKLYTVRNQSFPSWGNKWIPPDSIGKGQRLTNDIDHIFWSLL